MKKQYSTYVLVAPESEYNITVYWEKCGGGGLRILLFHCKTELTENPLDYPILLLIFELHNRKKEMGNKYLSYTRRCAPLALKFGTRKNPFFLV